MCPEPVDLGAEVGLEVPEGAEGHVGFRLPVGRGSIARRAPSSAPWSPHPVCSMRTISVGAEELLADDERADDVIGHEAAGVADDVRVARPQAERLLDVEAGVHARDDGERRRGFAVSAERSKVST